MPKIRIFIASPGDVAQERDTLSSIVIPELRRIFSIGPFSGVADGVELEAVRWETHAWPDVGEDAQDVINREIGEFDILVGVMWRRFGTPTRRASSGTGEEFKRAYDYFREYGRPKIMWYFRTEPFYTTSKGELTQFRKVLAFRGKLEDLGVLFWEFESWLEFERNVREHLIRQIVDLLGQDAFPAAGGASAPSEPESSELLTASAPPGPAYKPKVFLAHAQEDASSAREIFHRLRENGFSPWLATESLLPGQDWQMEIKRAIANTDFFLALLSSASEKEKGFVNKEISLALENVRELPLTDVYLVPVRLEPIEPRGELYSYQWIDYFADGGPEELIHTMKKTWKGRH